MPATPYTELSAAATPYFEGIPVPLDDCFCLFGLASPVSFGMMFPDPNVPYIELTGLAFSGTEMTVVAAAYAELTL